MGLDQYLIMKRKNEKKESVLGIMNGAFPLGIKSEGEQIGYFRKAYAVSNCILEEIGMLDSEEDHNCKDLKLTKENIEHIIDEAQWHLDEEVYEDDWEKLDWADAFTIFNNALKILEDDPDAEIYYKEWF